MKKSMFKNVSSLVKEKMLATKQRLSPLLKKLRGFSAVSILLALGWYAFLTFLPQPKFEAISLLIMIWTSIILLLITIFPQTIDRIKKIRFKDFELELQDYVSQSSPEDFKLLIESDEFNLSAKGSFKQLRDIILREILSPNSKPILLLVNLKNDNNISIAMLFIYIFFLDLVSKSVTLLFFSKKQNIRKIDDIEKTSIIGVISAKIVIQVFYKRFPNFLRIFELIKFPRTERITNFYWFASDNLKYMLMEESFSTIFNGLNFEKLLTKDEVQNLFEGKLNLRTVDLSFASQDLRTIRQALESGDEFIITTKDDRLRSIISLCYFSKDLSKKILAEITLRK
ncbi:MAG: hypothetical protein IAE91_02335 [Ignavibacteriaceae bacterium]|nr:hypothetical protein [Ignavibacteriaceae bacterium]